MKRMATITVVMLLASASEAGQPMVPFTLRSMGPGFDLFGLPMVPDSGGAMVPNGNGGASPPGGCTGAADFSDGCAIAVFGH